MRFLPGHNAKATANHRLPQRWVVEDRGYLTPCHIWTGAAAANGYAHVRIDGAQVGVHRLAFEEAHGRIPEGMEIDHRCFVTLCVNAEHLEAVTSAVNIERRRSTKLTRAAVLEIRRAAAKGATPTALGRRFGVSASAVHSVIKRRTWQHVGDA